VNPEILAFIKAEARAGTQPDRTNPPEETESESEQHRSRPKVAPQQKGHS